MCSSSPPPAPDYEGAAEATAEGNLEAVRYATEANRATQNTPWGTSSWTRPNLETTFDQAGYDAAMAEYNEAASQMAGHPGWASSSAVRPAPNKEDFYITTGADQWVQDITLSPEQQALFNTNTRTNQAMADIGLAGLNSARNIFETPVDFSGLGEYKNYDDFRQGIMDNMLTRSNTQIEQDREAMAAQLIAQGIPRGSEAFNREMTRLDQKQTDARQQAELGATQQTGEMINQAGNIRRQKIQELLTQRQNPLNELNAFRTGTQVQSPQFSAVPQQQTTLGPDYMGATTAQGNWDLADWNADQARNNAIMGGLFGLGGSYLMGPR